MWWRSAHLGPERPLIELYRTGERLQELLGPEL
ncbi:hypothetical protein M2280_002188 [Prescottella agglutinans]|uniref:Uncharacterized protein n=1 Tax=Prescottella agglutinans TaxID=1644129 RepID=A0ABT6M9Q9_9NOCA|nr:hypothetical protein [Prescottella agglutinans]